MTPRRLLYWCATLIAVCIVSALLLVVAIGLRQPRRVTLPPPTGPFAVGRMSMDWRDDHRLDPFADVSHARELPVWIWYPADRGGGARPAVYMPDGLRKAMEPSSTLARSILGRLTTDRANVTAHALEAPSVAGRDETFPVVLLKPALGAAAVQNSVLAEDLASHGYIVVGSDSPYTTPAVIHQDGRVVRRNAAGHPPENAPGTVSDLAPGQPNDFYLPVLDVWVADHRFVLDRLHRR